MNDIKKAFEDKYSPDKTKTYVKEHAYQNSFPYKPVIAVLSCALVGMFAYHFIPSSGTLLETRSTAMYDEAAAETADYDMTSSTNSSYGEKISYSSSISYETDNIQETSEKLEALVDQYEGYITYSNTYTYDDETSTSYDIEVPADAFDDFMNQAKSIAEVTNTSTSANDITDQYIDTEARLTNLKAEEETLQELLDQAETLSDVIAINDQLTSVRSDIESYESQKEYYDSLTEYASVSIYINSSASSASFPEKLADAFTNTFSNFLNVLANIAIILVYALPFILVIGCIMIIIHFIRKRR